MPLRQRGVGVRRFMPMKIEARLPSILAAIPAGPRPIIADLEKTQSF